MKKQKDETEKDLVILATSIYSGGGQYTEAAIEGQGVKSFCLMNCVFETNPEDNLTRFDEYIRDMKPNVIVMDNHWSAQGMTAMSKGLVDFADKMHQRGIEVFCLNREQSSGFRCELWSFHKPLRFRDMKDPVYHLARIGMFGAETFSVKDGKPISFSGGDGGMEDREHVLHTHQAFQERDWPNILKKITEEMQS